MPTPWPQPPNTPAVSITTGRLALAIVVVAATSAITKQTETTRQTDALGQQVRVITIVARFVDEQPCSPMTDTLVQFQAAIDVIPCAIDKHAYPEKADGLGQPRSHISIVACQINQHADTQIAAALVESFICLIGIVPLVIHDDPRWDGSPHRSRLWTGVHVIAAQIENGSVGDFLVAIAPHARDQDRAIHRVAFDDHFARQIDARCLDRIAQRL